MGRRKSKTLTDLELEIMQLVWHSGEITVEEVSNTLKKLGKPLALPSIRKMFSILQEKGYVTRRPKGRGYAYRPLVSEAQAHKGFLHDLVDRAFSGSSIGLVAALLDHKMVPEKDLKKVKELIEEYEKKRN